MQLNGANIIVSETRDGDRVQQREVHSDVPLCILQHSEERIRGRTLRHTNDNKKCFFTNGDVRTCVNTPESDASFSILRHLALCEESDTFEFEHDFFCGDDIEEALTSDSDSTSQALTTRNVISMCPKVTEEQIKGDKATSLCYPQTHVSLSKELAFL